MRKNKLTFVDCRVYCWKCGGLTKLTPTHQGLKPCHLCGADLLRWYLEKVGLRQRRKAGEDTRSIQKTTNSEKQSIILGNSASESCVKGTEDYENNTHQ